MSRNVSVPVLLYHRITGNKPGSLPALSVSVERFLEQLKWLARHRYTAISIDQWQSALEGQIRRPVLITFDDAYSELCEHAFPLLRRYGFHATVYVVSSLLGGYNEWDVAQGHCPHPLMNAEEIRYWAAHGIDFGAHSRTHRDLTRLEAVDLVAEVKGSGTDLACILGQAVRAFAYPFGYSNMEVQSCAAQNFQLGFTCDGGVNSIQTDPHRLRRSMVQPHDTMVDFAMRIRFGYAPFAAARSAVRLRTRFRAALHLPTPGLA